MLNGRYNEVKVSGPASGFCADGGPARPQPAPDRLAPSAYASLEKGSLVARTPTKPATIVSVANQKGGVAKTTSVASLGAAFAEQGKRVLLVDLDAQACLTFSLGVDPDEVDSSINEVLLGRASIADVRVACDDGVDLVPSVIDLAGAEAQLLPRPAAPRAPRPTATSPRRWPRSSDPGRARSRRRRDRHL
jgi:Mrp family chromosome partitioning ATPase